MVRQRARIRYRKQGDLRLLGHQDLTHVWERLFRRAGVRMCMSEGFHPRPKMNLPSALALGVVGLDEVVEVDFDHPADAPLARGDELLAQWLPQCPVGLVINSIEMLAADVPSADVCQATLEIPVPPERLAVLSQRVAELLDAPTVIVARGPEAKRVDLRPHIVSLELLDARLRVRLRVGNEGSVRPRELLEVLGLADLEDQGYYWTRTSLELRS